jgi:NADPH:quinone reductase-like Zn-dependent oxidoreductase
MKAAFYTKAKSGKILELTDVEQPIPDDKEVVIRVRAASVNPLDWRMKTKRPGVDVAGEIIAVGQGVTQFKAGDAVFGAGNGTFAEYARASANKLALKPERVTFEQAAAVPIAGLTALQALRDKGHIQPQQKILINGASGGIGTFAVQIAKTFGGNVTGVCSTRNVELVRSLGADRIIDYTREDFTDDNHRYDLILDNVGNRTLSAMKRVLNPHGKCVMAGAPKKMSAVFTRIVKAFVWSQFLRQQFRFFIANINHNDLTLLCELIQAGKVSPRIDKRYSLVQTADAHRVRGARARSRESPDRGRIVFRNRPFHENFAVWSVELS